MADNIHFEILDHNIILELDYVSYILDVWAGEKTDPATTITRYIGVWKGADLEKEDGEAFDPDFGESGYVSRYGINSREVKPKPLHWDVLEEVQKADREAEQHRSESESLERPLDDSHYDYSGRRAASKEQHEAFWAAIERVSENDDDEEAWETINKYRLRYVMQHEKA